MDRIIRLGAPEEIFARCTEFELDGERFPMSHLLIETLHLLIETLHLLIETLKEETLTRRSTSNSVPMASACWPSPARR
jgi:hypothetical protein